MSNNSKIHDTVRRMLVSMIVMVHLGCTTPRAGEVPTEHDDRTFDVFLRTMDTPDTDLASRREAARELATKSDGNPWVIMILSTADWARPDDEFAGDVFEDRRGRNIFDTTVVAALLDALPVDTDPSVLWAVTDLLDDHSFGRDSATISMDGEEIIAEFVTPPLSELAHRVLVRSLNVDHGYDKAGWRREIIQRFAEPNGVVGEAAPPDRRLLVDDAWVRKNIELDASHAVVMKKLQEGAGASPRTWPTSILLYTGKSKEGYLFLFGQGPYRLDPDSLSAIMHLDEDGNTSRIIKGELPQQWSDFFEGKTMSGPYPGRAN